MDKTKNKLSYIVITDDLIETELNNIKKDIKHPIILESSTPLDYTEKYIQNVNIVENDYYKYHYVLIIKPKIMKQQIKQHKREFKEKKYNNHIDQIKIIIKQKINKYEYKKKRMETDKRRCEKNKIRRHLYKLKYEKIKRGFSTEAKGCLN